MEANKTKQDRILSDIEAIGERKGMLIEEAIDNNVPFTLLLLALLAGLYKYLKTVDFE